MEQQKYKDFAVEDFLKLQPDRQHEIVSYLLSISKIHKFISKKDKPLFLAVKQVVIVLKSFYKFGLNNPLNVKNEEIKICFYPPQWQIKKYGILEAYINYFAHHVTQGEPHDNNIRFYSLSKVKSIKNWIKTLTNPDKKYFQYYRQTYSAIISKNAGNNADDLALFVLRFDYLNKKILRVHSLSPLRSEFNILNKTVDFIDKSKKSENQLLEVRSFNKFNPLLSSSGIDYSAPLTSYKPESDTNIQKKSNTPTNINENSQNTNNQNNTTLKTGGTINNQTLNTKHLNMKHQITPQEIASFKAYVTEFYGIGGIYEHFFKPLGATEQEIDTAIDAYIKQLNNQTSNITWGGGDSTDRERVREIMLQARGLTPSFKDGGGVEGFARGGGIKNTLEKLYDIDAKAYEYAKANSGGELYSSPEMQLKYKMYLDEAIAKAKLKLPLSMKIHEELQDANYHSLNQYLYLSGAYGPEEKQKWVSFLKEKPRTYFLDYKLYENQPSKTFTGKIPMKEIKIHWVDGKQRDKFPKTFTSWTEANEFLKFYTPGDNEGYNKAKFTVTFEDGDQYQDGRVDLSPREDNPYATNNVIGKHIYDYLTWLVNNSKSTETLESKREIQKYLDTYDLGIQEPENPYLLKLKGVPTPKPVNAPKELKGYGVNIYKHYDSSQNTVSGKFDRIVLVTDGVNGDSSTVMSDKPYIKLVKRELFGKTHLSAVPVNDGKDGKHHMMGGNFVWSSDSRFRENINEYPIPLHDRVEDYEKGGDINTTIETYFDDDSNLSANYGGHKFTFLAQGYNDKSEFVYDLLKDGKKVSESSNIFELKKQIPQLKDGGNIPHGFLILVTPKNAPAYVSETHGIINMRQSANEAAKQVRKQFTNNNDYISGAEVISTTDLRAAEYLQTINPKPETINLLPLVAKHYPKTVKDYGVTEAFIDSFGEFRMTSNFDIPFDTATEIEHWVLTNHKPTFETGGGIYGIEKQVSQNIFNHISSLDKEQLVKMKRELVSEINRSELHDKDFNRLISLKKELNLINHRLELDINDGLNNTFENGGEITAEYVGEDDWNRKLYKASNGTTYGMVDGQLYLLTNEGEPLYPTKKNIKIITESPNQDYKHTYMMLGRLQSDNDYFLGYGNRNEKRLWAGSTDAQIAEMKKLWNQLPENKKPEWLSYQDILDYEAKMKESFAKGGNINNHYDELYKKANNSVQGALELYAGELGIYGMFFGHKVDPAKKAKVKKLQNYLEHKYAKGGKVKNIDEETTLLPEAMAQGIAENSAEHILRTELQNWDNLDAEQRKALDAKYRNLTNKIADYLVLRANTTYKNNEQYRKAIKKDNRAAIDYMEKFMRHWAGFWGEKWEGGNGKLQKSIERYYADVKKASNKKEDGGNITEPQPYAELKADGGDKRSLGGFAAGVVVGAAGLYAAQKTFNKPAPQQTPNTQTSNTKTSNWKDEVKAAIDKEGFDEAFTSYSNWDEIKNPKFQTLKKQYATALNAIATYINQSELYASLPEITVKDAVEKEGLDYALYGYHDWSDVKDKKFHALRAKYISTRKDLAKYLGVKHFDKGGNISFTELEKKVAKQYVGKPVPKKYQAEYGKTYSKEEAKVVGIKVANKVKNQKQKSKLASKLATKKK